MIDTTKLTFRVKMVIYDGVNTTPENPDIVVDEPFYGEDEIIIVAARAARIFRRHVETEQ